MNKKFQYRTQDILDKIPDGWDKITFDFYLNKLMKLNITNSEDPLEIMDNNLELVALFLDLPKNIVEQLPMSLIKQINNKLSFISEKPKRIKSSRYRWFEDLNEPTYDDFVTFVKVSEQLEKGVMDNFPLLIKIVLRDKMTEEQILKMPMDEIENGFFLLRKFSMKFLKSTMKDLQVKIITEKTNEMIDKMKVVEGMNFRMRLKILNESYKELMGGTF